MLPVAMRNLAETAFGRFPVHASQMEAMRD